jgi:hypothetical protein
MQGATDGGKHIEAMRTGHMRRGRCALCRSFVEHLEGHHEKYRPERKIYLCHFCHHRVHFRPYHLSDREKEQLLRCRHGDEKFYAFRGKPRVMALMRKTYIAPGRRPAQLELRKKLKR